MPWNNNNAGCACMSMPWPCSLSCNIIALNIKLLSVIACGFKQKYLTVDFTVTLNVMGIILYLGPVYGFSILLKDALNIHPL